MNYTKENPLKVLSLGGGVQSSVIALMIAKGELPSHQQVNNFENECEGMCGV